MSDPEKVSQSDQFALLRSKAAFGGLSDSAIHLILSESENVVHAADDYFFCEGELGESLFILEAGTVLIERLWRGESIVLGRLVTGDCFGEMSLIDFQPRSASVRAESNCQAIQVHAKTLRSLYRHSIEQYAMIMMNLGREVSRRLRSADECLLRLQQDHDVPQFETSKLV